MNRKNVLSRVFESSERILSAKLDAIRAAYNHAGLKGSAVEEAFRDIFEEYLPENIGVSTGIIVDVNGHATKQLDIICYDKAKAPKFFSAGGASVFPAECVYFVFEVKTTLGVSHLESIYANLDSVKKLRKAAYVSNPSPIKQKFRIWGEDHDHFPILYGVLALESNSPNFSGSYCKLQLKRPVTKRIDCMFVLGSGAYVNVKPHQGNVTELSFCPDNSTYIALKEDEALMTFWALFSVYYGQAKMFNDLDFAKYIQHSDLNVTLLGFDDPTTLKGFIVDYMVANDGAFPPQLAPVDKATEEVMRTAYTARLAADNP